MPRYFFTITRAGLARPPAESIEFVDDNAAWEEAIVAFGELVRGPRTRLRPGETWRMDVTRENHEMLYTLAVRFQNRTRG
jgi:hypothetical protein